MLQCVLDDPYSCTQSCMRYDLAWASIISLHSCRVMNYLGKYCESPMNNSSGVRKTQRGPDAASRVLELCLLSAAWPWCLLNVVFTKPGHEVSHDQAGSACSEHFPYIHTFPYTTLTAASNLTDFFKARKILRINGWFVFERHASNMRSFRFPNLKYLFRARSPRL